MMRRCAMAVAGLGILVASGGFGNAAGASTGQIVNHVKAGQQWTIEEHQLSGTGWAYCEILTFGAGNTYTTDKFGDSGTYTGGGATITITGTLGTQSSTFTGTLSAGRKHYSGTWSYPNVNARAHLVKGAHSTDPSGDIC